MLSQSVKPQIQNPFSMWRAGNPYSALAPFNTVAEDKSTNKGTLWNNFNSEPFSRLPSYLSVSGVHFVPLDFDSNREDKIYLNLF